MTKFEAGTAGPRGGAIPLLRFVLCAIGLMAGQMLATPVVGASSPSGNAPGHPLGVGIYDPANGCINNKTSLPSVRGNQFVVYSPAGVSGSAHAAAVDIRSKDVFGTYERGLGIPSLRQPGQPARFPVFLDPAYRHDGEFTHLCQRPTWGAVVINGTLSGDHLAATVYHELFHAAQFALLGTLSTNDNWWFEATATAAEAWFGSHDHTNFAPAVTDHPGAPMDKFDSSLTSLHQYGAYLFVQWVMQSASMPSAGGWAFLRASIKDVASHAPDWDAGLDKALTNLPPPSACDTAITVLACDVASFWGDETNQTGPAPRFGPPAKRIRDVIRDSEETHTIPPVKQYGASMFAFVPASGIDKMEVIVPTLPAGVEVWLNLGHGTLQEVQPGDSFDETFCRTSPPEGTHQLPSTGDVRMAMTTTTTHAPSEVTVKFVTGPSCETNGIMLYQQSVNGGGTVATTFRSAACKRKAATPGHSKQFQAVAKSGAYKLTVSIKQFAGFHTYPVDFESADPSFVVDGPGGPFSNIYWPGGTPPNHGGYITFSSNGTIMGLGFINAWNADFSDSILLAGTLACNYSGH